MSRVPAVVVLAVVSAGYLQSPLEPEEEGVVAKERLPDFFPRALGLAKTWRSEAAPARVEGGGGFAPPPEGVPHEVVASSAVGAHAPGAGTTYVFVDAATGDLLLVTVDGDAAATAEVPAARAPEGAPSPSGLLGAVDPLVETVTAPLATARPLPVAPPPPVPVEAEAATCDGWWICLVVHFQAWWGA